MIAMGKSFFEHVIDCADMDVRRASDAASPYASVQADDLVIANMHDAFRGSGDFYFEGLDPDDALFFKFLDDGRIEHYSIPYHGLTVSEVIAQLDSAVPYAVQSREDLDASLDGAYESYVRMKEARDASLAKK